MNTTTPTKTVETVVKITSTMPQNKSYLLEPKIYGERSLVDAVNEMCSFKKSIEAITDLIEHLNIYPKDPIEETIKKYFPDTNVEIKQKTKTTKQYWVPFLYIHTEIKEITNP